MKDNQLFYHVKPNIWISYDNLKNSNKFAPKAQVGKIKLEHDVQVYTDPAFEKKTEKKPVLVGEGRDFERIRRITGYLVGTTDRWNNAKRAEERDRVKHMEIQH